MKSEQKNFENLINQKAKQRLINVLKCCQATINLCINIDKFNVYLKIICILYINMFMWSYKRVEIILLFQIKCDGLFLFHYEKFKLCSDEKTRWISESRINFYTEKFKFLFHIYD